MLDLFEVEKPNEKDAMGIDQDSLSKDPAGDLRSRTFESDVTSVVNSGLIMRPIYELTMKGVRQSEEEILAWECVDVMWLAFAILDTISELGEYHVGASRKEVLARVLPLAFDQAKARNRDITEKGLKRVLDKIFDHLVNRENRYLPFEYSFFNGATGAFELRKFWLIKAVYTGQGKESLFALTDEGYSAYFGLHESGALDAAAIGNLRIRLLIERGSVDDAISVAEQNKKQCIRKKLEVRNTRRTIQRNIRSVDFERIDAMADEGARQAADIQIESGRLHHMVMDNLLKLPEGDQRYKLNRLAEHLEKLNGRQMELVSELQRLPDDYHQNSHKLFRRRAIGVLPPMEEVMRRVCLMEESDASATGREFIAIFDPPVCRPLFDPGTLIDAMEILLEKRIAAGDNRQAVHEIDGESLELYAPELSEALMGDAFSVLHQNVKPQTQLLMSELLETAAQKGDNDLLPVAVAMAVFQCIADRRTADKNYIGIELVSPAKNIRYQLPDGRLYRGHELLLTFRGSAS